MRRIEPQDFRYTVTEANYSTLVTVADIREFTIVDETANTVIDNQDAAIIQDLIDSAIQYWIDETGAYPINASIVAALDYSPGDCYFSSISGAVVDCWLSGAPIADVTKVYGINADATEDVAAVSDYVVDKQNAVVRSLNWPSGDADLDAFKIEYTAGLGADGTQTPEEVKTAIKMIVSHWFEYRQPINDIVNNVVPDHARRIVRKYKPARL